MYDKEHIRTVKKEMLRLRIEKKKEDKHVRDSEGKFSITICDKRRRCYKDLQEALSTPVIKSI